MPPAVQGKENEVQVGVKDRVQPLLLAQTKMLGVDRFSCARGFFAKDV